MSSAHGQAFRPPGPQRERLDKATRLEWISIVFLLTIVAAMAAAMGNSEAMQAVLVEDVLGFVPPVAYLIGARWRDKDPTDKFPYGYRRAGQIGYLAGALALFGFGAYILVDAIMTLIKAQPPTIGTVGVGGHRIWAGWFMLAALVYGVIPPLLLGRKKIAIACELHQKGLYTDAELNRGDWLSGLAGIFGIVGIGCGLWWADAAAAAVIAIEIVWDGVQSLKNSVAQLMNRRPSTVKYNEKDPVLDQLEAAMERLPWVKQVRVRLREDGDALTGEIFVVATTVEDILDKLDEATKAALAVDWRLHDLNILPVRSLET